jgi:sec-independent protein translocase protein TatA
MEGDAVVLAFFFGGAPSSSELILVFVAILLLFGAKRLPSIARNMGKAMEEFRRAARDVTDEIMQADVKPPEPAPHTLPRRDVVDEEGFDSEDPYADLPEEEAAAAPADTPAEEEPPSSPDDEIAEDDERKRDTPD